MRERRVAIVAASLEILGGQGIQATALARRLESEGWDVRFLPVNPRFPQRLQAIRDWPYVRTVVNEALYLPSLAALREVDRVHVFSASYWSFLLGPAPAIVAAKALGKRVVLNYHSGEAEDHLSRWGLGIHPYLRLADEIVVPSEFLREVFARHGYTARVIPNIVDTRQFRYRERNPLRPSLLSTRNLEAYYSVDTVIEAFARVQQACPEATLTVAGYGSQEGYLRALAAGLGVSGVQFVGRVEPDRTAALYDSADVYVNASVLDNQPVSLLEAFASGLPVVSTAVGDVPNMIRHGEAGLLVPCRDPQAMADAVLSLLRDPEGARRLARRAHEGLAAYAWPQVRAAWERVYFGEAA